MKSLPTLLVIFACALSCAQPTPPPPEEEPAGHALIVGGNSSHDFERWFNQEDSATLAEIGWTTAYTEDVSTIREGLKEADILILTNNQPIPDSLARQAIFDFADSGKGLLLIHPAVWYNWEDWEIYNQELVGGGSRSHGPYGAFEVTITQPNHPVVADIEANFTLEDELYRFELAPGGSEIDVLAVGTEPDTGTEYPVAWTVKHPTRKIIGITLGHDAYTHQSDQYKKLLTNSVMYLMQ